MGVRVDGAAGPLALGAKGSVRDWLTPPGRAPGVRPRELYSTAALARHGALSGAIFYAAFGGENLNNRPAGVGNAIPLWWLAPPPFPRKRGHYKAPLCCELLMKGLLFRALWAHRSAVAREHDS